MKKNLLYLILSFCMSSCFFQKNIRTNFEYVEYEKTIDFRKGNWLITNQSIVNTDYDNSFNLHPLKQFLGNRLKQIETLKNKKEQYIYPFPIDKVLSKKELKTIHSLTNYDYLIIPFVKNTFNDVTNRKVPISINENRSNEMKFEVLLYNLVKGDLEYHLICYAAELESSDRKNDILSSFDTKEIAKKIIKEIKKHAYY